MFAFNKGSYRDILIHLTISQADKGIKISYETCSSKSVGNLKSGEIMAALVCTVKKCHQTEKLKISTNNITFFNANEMASFNNVLGWRISWYENYKFYRQHIWLLVEPKSLDAILK